jgi:hypothetical protein
VTSTGYGLPHPDYVRSTSSRSWSRSGSSTSSPGRPTSRADPTALRWRPRSTGSLTGSSQTGLG